MASFIVPAGTTQTSRIDMSGSDDLTVQATGALSVSANAQAVRFVGPTNGAIITNSGTIEAVGDQEDPRAIRFEDEVGSLLTATINNESTGIIRSRSDAIQIQDGTVSAGLLTIGNSGAILSTNGQALDFAAGLGTFLVDISNSGTIGSEFQDAIRIGSSATINNTGTINGGAAAAYSVNVDGIQFEDGASGDVTNGARGVISGDRHGINAGTGTVVEVTNTVNATITGRNGSGVGVDGSATVVNSGTITGAFSDSPGSDINGPGGAPDGINDGDGDGIDIDGRAVIYNSGLIQGTGAGGNGSDGLPNTSEGIAAGGGYIDNSAGGTIRGVGLGILIDDSSQGPSLFRTVIANDGLIEGTNSIGVRIISDFNDVIVNNGTITGGGGTAIQFGNGDDTLSLGSGSVINGVSDGGGGDHNRLSYASFGPGGVSVVLAAGTATGTGGVTSFQDVIGSAGDDLILGGAGANALSGGQGADTLSGGNGQDITTGGLGNDVHVVADRIDMVREADGEGVDTVRALSSYTLKAGASVEILSAFDRSATTALSLIGNEFGNTVIGNAGSNLLRGNAGADRLYAGADTNARDTFVFTQAADAGATGGTSDQIFQFDRSAGPGDATSDRIDLRQIDADDEIAGDQSFRFVTQFSPVPDDQVEGQVRVVQVGTDARVFIDVDGDSAADMLIQVRNVSGLSEADFLL